MRKSPTLYSAARKSSLRSVLCMPSLARLSGRARQAENYIGWDMTMACCMSMAERLRLRSDCISSPTAGPPWL